MEGNNCGEEAYQGLNNGLKACVQKILDLEEELQNFRDRFDESESMIIEVLQLHQSELESRRESERKWEKWINFAKKLFAFLIGLSVIIGGLWSLAQLLNLFGFIQSPSP